MDLTPLIPQGRQIVEGYGDGGFRISGKRLEGSVIVFPGEVMAWPAASFQAIDLANLEPVAQAGREGRVDLLLIGCGERLLRVEKSIRDHLRSAGIVVEVMDTGAACRTYNVLMSEGRRVAAALIAV